MGTCSASGKRARSVKGTRAALSPWVDALLGAFMHDRALRVQDVQGRKILVNFRT